MKQELIVGLVALALGAGGGLFYLKRQPPAKQGKPAADAAFCQRHQLAERDCPWCNKALVQQLGECKGHGVPEAFCSRCNPKLIPGFKAEKDWCAEHGLPESQCTACRKKEKKQ